MTSLCFTRDNCKPGPRRKASRALVGGVIAAMLAGAVPAAAAPWAKSVQVAPVFQVEQVRSRVRRGNNNSGAIIAGAIGLGILGIAAAAASQRRDAYEYRQGPAYGYGHPGYGQAYGNGYAYGHAPAYGYAQPQPNYGYGAPAYGYDPRHDRQVIYAQPRHHYAPHGGYRQSRTLPPGGNRAANN